MFSYSIFLKNNVVQNTNVRDSSTDFYNNASNYKNLLSLNGIDVDNYSNFLTYYTTNTGAIYNTVVIYMWNGGTVSVNNTTLTASNITSGKYVSIYVPDITLGSSNDLTGSFSTSGIAKNMWWGLQEQSTISNYYNWFLENRLTYINILPRDNLKSTNLPWYIADVRIGIDYNYSIVLEFQGNSVGITTIEQDVSSGKLYQVLINNIENFMTNGTYNLYVRNNTSNVVHKDFYLEWDVISPTR